MAYIKCFRSCNCTLKSFKGSTPIEGGVDRDKTCAGVCVISKKKILVNQSYNLFWGIPKGIVENNESLIDCALRELEEETSVKLEPTDLAKYVFSFRYTNINRKICIFFAILPDYHVLNELSFDNDSTGYGFIKPLCLLELFYSRKIKINYFTRVLINKLFL